MTAIQQLRREVLESRLFRALANPETYERYEDYVREYVAHHGKDKYNPFYAPSLFRGKIEEGYYGDKIAFEGPKEVRQLTRKIHKLELQQKKIHFELDFYCLDLLKDLYGVIPPEDYPGNVFFQFLEMDEKKRKTAVEKLSYRAIVGITDILAACPILEYENFMGRSVEAQLMFDFKYLRNDRESGAYAPVYSGMKGFKPTRKGKKLHKQLVKEHFYGFSMLMTDRWLVNEGWQSVLERKSEWFDAKDKA